MADYSKWEAMARAEEEAERREKEEKRAANRDKYYKEQEEKKMKYMQEQEAKKKSGADSHAGHSHGGDGHSHGHSHSHSHPDVPPPGMQPLLSTVPRPACGCGYADVEEMKRAAEAAALQPQLSAEEKTRRKVSAVHATREHGKQLYLEGKYAEAFAVYERGVLIASGIFNVDDALQAELTAIEVLLDVNMAQCQLKLANWKAAADQARMALQLDPQCAKAHFRMAQAYVGMGEYEQARACLTRCTEADTAGSTRRDVAALHADIRRREADEKEKLHKFTKQLEAKMAKEKAFGGGGRDDEQMAKATAAEATADSAAATAAQPAHHSAAPSTAASPTTSATTTAAPSAHSDDDLSDLTQSLRTAHLQPADPDSWTTDGAAHQPPAAAATADPTSTAAATART